MNPLSGAHKIAPRPTIHKSNKFEGAIGTSYHAACLRPDTTQLRHGERLTEAGPASPCNQTIRSQDRRHDNLAPVYPHRLSRTMLFTWNPKTQIPSGPSRFDSIRLELHGIRNNYHVKITIRSMKKQPNMKKTVFLSRSARHASYCLECCFGAYNLRKPFELSSN